MKRNSRDGTRIWSKGGSPFLLKLNPVKYLWTMYQKYLKTMSSPLILSILEKAENINAVCKAFPDFADYRELNETVTLFNEILPPLIVVADSDHAQWAQEVNAVLDNLIKMFPNLYAASCSIRSEDYDGTGVYGIVPTSFALIQKELTTYHKILMEYVGKKEARNMAKYAKTLEHHRTAPYRWCILQDKKCIPVLNFHNKVLFEDWVPEN